METCQLQGTSREIWVKGRWGIRRGPQIFEVFSCCFSNEQFASFCSSQIGRMLEAVMVWWFVFFCIKEREHK